MADWEMYDGKEVNGPFSEAAIIEVIKRGLPATVLVRRVGATDWGGFRSHAPFAMALEQAKASTPPPAAPLPVYQFPTTVVVNPGEGGCFRTVNLLVGGILILMFACGLIAMLTGR